MFLCKVLYIQTSYWNYGKSSRNINFKCVGARRCLLGEGGYGQVYKGKLKQKLEATQSIDLSVKHTNGPHQVEYWKMMI